MKTFKLIIRIPIGILLGLIMLIGGYSAIPIGFLLSGMGFLAWIGYLLKPELSEHDKWEREQAFEMIFAWPYLSYYTAWSFITTGEIPD